MTDKPQTLKLDSVEAEKEVICLTVNNSHFTVQFINDLLPEYFNNPACQLTMKSIRVYFSKYNGMPTKLQVATLINKIVTQKQSKDKKEKNYSKPADLEETLEYIFTDKKLKEHQLKFYEDEIERFIKQNKVRNAFYESIDLIEDVEKFDEIESKFKAAILWHADKNLGVEIQDVNERYDKIKKVFENFIPLPYKKLSEVIGGGMLPKSLTYIAAQSGLGKSILLDMISFYCWKELGMNVIIASLELSEEVKSLRIDAQFMDSPTRELIKDSKRVESAYKALGDRDNHLFIKEFPSGTSSKSISRYIHRLRSFYDIKIGLISVDYADIVSPNSMKKVSLYSDGGDVSEELRFLGYEYNCPTLTATQLNRCIFIESELTKSDGTKIKIKDIKIGDRIKGKNTSVTVEKVFPVEKKIGYKIKTKSGKEIICSKEHLWPTTDGEKNIKNGLKVGDILFSERENYVDCEDEIISIEETGEIEMIDISVSGDHLFLANGILTHNSASDLPIEDINRTHIAESNKKFNTADTMIAFGGTPDQRAQGNLFAKTLKARHGQENIIIPFDVEYQYLKITER